MYYFLHSSSLIRLVMNILLRPALINPPPLSNWPLQIIGISAVEIDVDELDWCAAVKRLRPS